MNSLSSRKSMIKFGDRKVKYKLSKEKLSDFQDEAKELRRKDKRERKEWHKKLSDQTEKKDG